MIISEAGKTTALLFSRCHCLLGLRLGCIWAKRRNQTTPPSHSPTIFTHGFLSSLQMNHPHLSSLQPKHFYPLWYLRPDNINAQSRWAAAAEQKTNRGGIAKVKKQKLNSDVSPLWAAISKSRTGKSLELKWNTHGRMYCTEGGEDRHRAGEDGGDSAITRFR